MSIAIVAAVGTNRAIGRDNELLWHLPGDLPRFKQLTTGHPVIMGRKTYESIGHPLPARLNIVVTRNAAFHAEGVTIAHSLDDALAIAADAALTAGDIFVIGGGEIYAQTIERADRLYLTEVDDAPADADAFFPAYDDFAHVLDSEAHTAGPLTYRFVTRTRPPA